MKKIRNNPLSRRRFISMVACAAGCAVVPGVATAALPQPFRWQGDVMGGLASMTLYTNDKKQAELVCEQCLTEIRRLEGILSLYRPASSIRYLNKEGTLKNPPAELVQLVKKSIRLSELSEGAFDITLQPLWHYLFYAKEETLDPKRIAALQQLIDFRKIRVSDQLISLSTPGMMITLNGIAQGFITDRITKIFRQNGFKNVLVELGETYGSGRNAENRPWQIGIQSPDGQDLLRIVDLENLSLATSGGYGTPFGEGKELHHLIDPKTGSSAKRFKSVSVVAASATDADGLSTTLALVGKEDHIRILNHFPGSSAYILTAEHTLESVVT
ncbi:FAD:protein FMN transferase [Oligoflexia bacterium]|nr:FAD:protein FMN transferase [Oligoflexia bacterium]